MESALTKIELSELQQELLRVHWLESLRWMDRRARSNWRLYTALRLIAVLGGVFVPALVAITPSPAWTQSVRVTTFVVSLCVAVATALEAFLRSGDRWRHYRRNTEALRLEGMDYLMLSGSYAKAGSHQAAFQDFAARLNGILSSEVGVYFTQIAVESRSPDKGGEADGGASPSTGSSG